MFRKRPKDKIPEDSGDELPPKTKVPQDKIPKGKIPKSETPKKILIPPTRDKQSKSDITPPVAAGSRLKKTKITSKQPKSIKSPKEKRPQQSGIAKRSVIKSKQPKQEKNPSSPPKKNTIKRLRPLRNKQIREKTPDLPPENNRSHFKDAPTTRNRRTPKERNKRTLQPPRSNGVITPKKIKNRGLSIRKKRKKDRPPAKQPKPFQNEIIKNKSPAKPKRRAVKQRKAPVTKRIKKASKKPSRNKQPRDKIPSEKVPLEKEPKTKEPREKVPR